MTTEIEQFVIDRVKQKRIEAGLSQADLATHLNVSNGFIGKVESPKYDTKYNLNHINMLAKIFNCSPAIFLPDKTLIND